MEGGEEGERVGGGAGEGGEERLFSRFFLGGVFYGRGGVRFFLFGFN